MGKASDNISLQETYYEWAFMQGHIIGSVFSSFFFFFFFLVSLFFPIAQGKGWSGGAMLLGKLSVPGRPTNLNSSRARAYCAYSRCG